MIYLCSCGFGTDDREWFQGHLWEHPGHDERPGPGYLLATGERSHGYAASLTAGPPLLVNGHLWSPSYLAVSAGDAPLAVIRPYIDTHKQPDQNHLKFPTRATGESRHTVDRYRVTAMLPHDVIGQ